MNVCVGVCKSCAGLIIASIPKEGERHTAPKCAKCSRVPLIPTHDAIGQQGPYSIILDDWQSAVSGSGCHPGAKPGDA